MQPLGSNPRPGARAAAPLVERSRPIAFDFDTPVDRRGTASVKWDKYGNRDVIPLWIADMDFRSPPEVCAALAARAAHGIFGYTHAPEALVETLIAKLRADYDWRVEREWLVWLPGLVTGINLSCRATGAPGDGVVTAVPAYPPFLTPPARSDRKLVTVPLLERNGRAALDLDGIARALHDSARLFILCNPHNPTGRVFTRAELEALLDVCRAHGAAVCSDEIHCGLVLDTEKRHLPLAALDPDFAARTITLMAPSKTYNVPGLGCSFAVIPGEELRRRFIAAKEGVVPEVNAFGYEAALAAYRHGDPWRDALLKYIRGNRDLVERRLAAMPGIAAAHVEATYLAWIDARGAGVSDPCRFFEAAGVGLGDGRHFGAPGFVRLNFACPRALLEKALDRMARALAERG